MFDLLNLPNTHGLRTLCDVVLVSTPWWWRFVSERGLSGPSQHKGRTALHPTDLQREERVQPPNPTEERLQVRPGEGKKGGGGESGAGWGRAVRGGGGYNNTHGLFIWQEGKGGEREAGIYIDVEL